jgi:AcrR family transcriptional regulator
MSNTSRQRIRRPSRARGASPVTAPPAPEAQGRVKQRGRTRKAIVDAAMTLLAGGETPSMDAVAKAADVSRRTVYMYFPTLDQLLIDATAGVLSQQALDSRLAPSDRGDGDSVESWTENRVEILARSVQGMSPELERLGRALIRLTVDAGGRERSPAGPLRGYRRVEWIERALSPLRVQLDDQRFDRLVSALAMVIGWEALIVQRDVRGLSAAAGEELSVWAARTLLRATLEEARESGEPRESIESREDASAAPQASRRARRPRIA